MPPPRIHAWPSDGHRWALVLTHDVERAEGYGFVEPKFARREAAVRVSIRVLLRSRAGLLRRIRAPRMCSAAAGSRSVSRRPAPRRRRHGARRVRGAATGDGSGTPTGWGAKGFRGAGNASEREGDGRARVRLRQLVQRHGPVRDRNPGGRARCTRTSLGRARRVAHHDANGSHPVRDLAQDDRRDEVESRRLGWLRDRGGMVLMLTASGLLARPQDHARVRAVPPVGVRRPHVLACAPVRGERMVAPSQGVEPAHRNDAWEIEGAAATDGRVAVVDRSSSRVR